MYKTQPKNPVDFLAKWLLNHGRVEKTALQTVEHHERVRELKDKQGYQASVERKEAELRAQEAQEQELKDTIFFEKISFSPDLNDQLQDLADFLKAKTNATAVYIGKRVAPKKPIAEDDDEQAHVSLEQEDARVIHFVHATEGHEYLVDKVLRPDQGLTFDVFAEDEPAEEERMLEEGEEGFEEQ